MKARRSFEEHWLPYGRQPGVSPGLEPLVRGMYEALVSESVDLVELREAIEQVLVFLANPAGRTDANCTAVDHFLCLGDFEWPDLPDGLQDVLGNMADALHDTVSAPDIAINFESTPEQLLVRLRSVQLPPERVEGD